MFERDSWGTVKLPNGQRKEVWREGDTMKVRDPGEEEHVTVPLGEFLSALVVDMDRKAGRPIHGDHLVDAVKMSTFPFQWKFYAYAFHIFVYAYVILLFLF
jgi:hypothetical protein